MNITSDNHDDVMLLRNTGARRVEVPLICLNGCVCFGVFVCLMKQQL